MCNVSLRNLSVVDDFILQRMALVAHSSKLQELHNATSSFCQDRTTYSPNFHMNCGDNDDDDDASFEVSDVSATYNSDINLAETIRSIQNENSFITQTSVTCSGVNSEISDDSGTSTNQPNSLKDGLRDKIIKRRLSRGDGELKVTFEPPKIYALSREERRKVELRKKRNRDSANKSRLRRKEYEDKLIEAVNKLDKENDKLEKEVKKLKSMKDTFQRILDDHVNTYHSTTFTTLTSV